MAKFLVLVAAATALSLTSCEGESNLFEDFVQPQSESAFAERNAMIHEQKDKSEIADERAGNDLVHPSSPEGMFYNLSDDPESLQLLALDSIDGSGDDMSVVVVDLFRGRERHGLMTTWHIDCVKSQMNVIRAAMVQQGKGSLDMPVETELISTQHSRKSRRMAQLVCEGEGQLQKDRVYRGTLTEIMTRFWDGKRVVIRQKAAITKLA